jgi:hypothetical protein
MATLRELITARVVAVLTGATPAGANVFRSREASITRAQTPAIVVMPDNEQDIRMGSYTDRHELTLAIEIFTRGDPWDQAADATADAAHKVMVTDATIAALAVDVRKVSTDYESQEADRTAGTLSARYVITYLSKAADLSAQP